MEEKSKSAFEIFNSKAKIYEDKFMDTSMYHESFDIFCGQISDGNARILDVGCGPGNITHYLLSKRQDFDVLGIDLAPNMIDLARINNPSAKFEVMDCREIGNMEGSFDGIVLGFCLPYLSKPEAAKLISDAKKLLNPQGLLYISTMEEDAGNQSGLQSSSSEEQLQQYFYTEKELSDRLMGNHFQTIATKRKHYHYNGSDVTDLILIAQKQSPCI